MPRNRPWRPRAPQTVLILCEQSSASSVVEMSCVVSNKGGGGEVYRLSSSDLPKGGKNRMLPLATSYVEDRYLYRVKAKSGDVEPDS